MKKAKIFLIIGIITIFLIGATILLIKIYGNIDLEQYIGYWHVKQDVMEESLTVDNDELNIVRIEGDTLTFDYNISMLCGEKNIKVKIKNKTGNFETKISKGTIKFKQDKIELTVKNINYDKEFKRTFIYKSKESKSLQKYIGKWCDSSNLNHIIMNSINNNEINFDLSIFRIVSFENLTAKYNETTDLIEFNTNDTDMGESWKGIYGNITLIDKEIILKITKSDCENISPNTYIFDITQ